MRATGYSLWLMPEGEAYNTLTALIQRWSERYSTPFFEPHVTLLSGVAGPEAQAVAQTRELSRVVHPFEIVLGRAAFSDEYFRCLFFSVEQTLPVTEANRDARRHFGRENDPPYFPHLSLIYGVLDPETKQEIAAGLQEHRALRFPVTTIHLFLTEGEVCNWRRISEFKLL